MNYSAIFFDLDGTLVNTIDYWAEAYMHSLRDIGVDISGQDFLDEIYVLNTSFDEIMQDIGVDTNTANIFRKKRDQRYEEILRTRPLWFAGTEELLRKTADKYPTGIVTGSHKSYIEAMEEQISFSPLVRTIVAADDTPGHGKPEPDGLLLAADRLGVDPKACIYIGDQQFDVEAANAAGMVSCLLWTEFTPATAGEEAEICVESFGEIRELLEL
ncbi:hypothetical protein COU76_05660 [Candidatus Peregrinibacteria bacterium CG10_big_fil_rev_8_21_14_0_10_49_10]|nr:MAG: hypothetical protein COU76_05660 [Candidatus Peregrinibacteria bacterium CG10_big_fil_rev_8_21_14_0_10_49_10]